VGRLLPEAPRRCALIQQPGNPGLFVVVSLLAI
jgi:hypothetical protein